MALAEESLHDLEVLEAADPLGWRVAVKRNVDIKFGICCKCGLPILERLHRSHRLGCFMATWLAE